MALSMDCYVKIKESKILKSTVFQRLFRHRLQTVI